MLYTCTKASSETHAVDFIKNVDVRRCHFVEEMNIVIEFICNSHSQLQCQLDLYTHREIERFFPKEYKSCLVSYLIWSQPLKIIHIQYNDLHEIYNFGGPFLGHHLFTIYLVCLFNAWEQRRRFAV